MVQESFEYTNPLENFSTKPLVEFPPVKFPSVMLPLVTFPLVTFPLVTFPLVTFLLAGSVRNSFMGVAVWPSPVMVTTMPLGTGMLLESVMENVLRSQGVSEDSCQL